MFDARRAPRIMKSRIGVLVTVVFSGMSIFCLFVKPAFAIKDAAQEIEGRGESSEAAQAAPGGKHDLGRPSIEYKGEDLKDPFESNLTEEEKPSEQQPGQGMMGTELGKIQELKVQGIIWGGANNQAIVNNKVVKVGDTLEDVAKVVKIEKDGVTIFYAGRPYKISPPAEAGIHKKDEGGENEKKH